MVLRTNVGTGNAVGKNPLQTNGEEVSGNAEKCTVANDAEELSQLSWGPSCPLGQPLIKQLACAFPLIGRPCDRHRVSINEETDE
jgi:hypothetical protein